MPVESQALAILFQPAAKRGPFADQGLVSDFSHPIVDGDQTRVGQESQDFPNARPVFGRGDQFLECGPPAGLSGCIVFAELSQAQEDVAGDPLLLGIQLIPEDVIGGFGDRPSHSAGGQVARDGERAPSASVPGLQERMREQGQRAGFRRLTPFRAHVVQQNLHQAGFELPFASARRFFDGAPQFICAHRAEERLPAGQRFPQVRVGTAMWIEVGAQGDDDEDGPTRLDGRGHQVVDERTPLRFLPAQGEEFFELVDQKQELPGFV